jgi:acetylornithine deacetylase
MSPTEQDLLQRLIQISSVNPAFVGDSRQNGGETDLADFLVDFLEKNHWPWLRQTVHPGRDNLIAVVRGSSPQADSDVTLWEVHQDTVGTEGMRIDPFAAEVRDGRIWGRGACDVKGGMAAMLTALTRVQQEPARQCSTIVLAMTVNEECGFTGAKSLGQLWSQDETNSANLGETTGPLTLEELRFLRPRQAIVAEPTLLSVVVAHKGVVRWRCRVRGRAAHSSQPERGVNAIYAMARVVHAIEQFQIQVLSQRPAHPLCGSPSVCVSTIQGGTGVNTVPDEVAIDIDRRVIPGEQSDVAYQELVDYVADDFAKHAVVERADCGQTTIEHELPWLESPGLDDQHNREWGRRVAAVVRSLGSASGLADGAGELIGVPYGTDAPAIAACGIPTVVFGPGSIDQAHTDDEWLDLEQLSRAVEIFCRLACTESH